MRPLAIAIAVVVAVGFTAAPCIAVAQSDADDTAAVLFQDGNFGEAATAYEVYHAEHPGDLTSELNLGAIRLYENDLTAADPLLRGVLAADPKNDRATRMLGELYRRRAEAERRTVVDGGEAVVPFVTADPLPVVRVVANGTAANFVIDTGADVALEPSFASAIGVATVPAGMGTFAGGRHAPMQSGMLRSLAIGGAVADDVPVHVLATTIASMFPGLKIDGVVGTTYFERFLATIDYPRNRLILRPRSPEGSSAFEATAAQSHTSVVPCYLVGDHFVMAVAQVDEAPAGLFLFDSGLAGGGLMPSQLLVETGGIALDRAHSSIGNGAGGPVQAIPLVAHAITVGTTMQHNVRGLYTPEGLRCGAQSRASSCATTPTPWTSTR
jgi:hypothetical protein